MSAHEPDEHLDPSKPAMVHDRLNDRTFKWKPETMQANYEKYADPPGPGVIEWDGLLLDGWLPVDARRAVLIAEDEAAIRDVRGLHEPIL